MTAPRPSVVTVVASVGLPGDVRIEDLERAILATLAGLGAELVGCNWTPDADTVADGLGVEYAELAVLDLNPGRAF